MGFTIRGTIDVTGVVRRLDGLKQGVRNGILRKAVSRAGRIVLKAARANCPVDTGPHLTVRGLLKKSLGIKVKTYRGAVVGIVGPRKGFKTQVAVRRRDGAKGKAGDPVYQSPDKIAHLVELGHGGPHPAPPHPFLRPAWDGSAAAVRRTFAQVIGDELAKLAQGRAALFAAAAAGGD